MRARRWACWALAGLVTAAAAVAADCPPAAAGEQVLQQGAVQLRWRAEPAVIRVGEPFVLLVSSCPAGLQLVKVDAVMPEHRHGMNYRPSIEALGSPGSGRWRVQGLLWHMSGRWELRFELRPPEGPVVRLQQPVVLP